MEQEKKDTRWYRFMSTDKFVVFMNIVRVLSLIAVVILVYVMLSNIEEVKLLGSDVCKLCMERPNVLCINSGNLAK